jgi:hypothetical protein
MTGREDAAASPRLDRVSALGMSDVILIAIPPEWRHRHGGGIKKPTDGTPVGG